MTRQRRHYSPEQMVALLREHRVDMAPVSDLCEKNGIAVNLWEEKGRRKGARNEWHFQARGLSVTSIAIVD